MLTVRPPRVVAGVPAGLGPLLPPGHPQHAHAVHGVVGLRDRQLPERSVREGTRGAGGTGPEARHQWSLSSGILGMVELGAQSIVYELATVVFMVSV